MIWSSANVALPLTNWIFETNVVASGDPIEVSILMGSRSNLFFRATEFRNYTTNLVYKGTIFGDDPTIFVSDAMGAIGPDNFVEVLNTLVTVYTRDGTLVAETNMAGFFSMTDLDGTVYPTQGRTIDPRVLYDSQAGRWVASTLDHPGSGQVIIAVSNGSSPTNLSTGWSRYLVRAQQTGLFADYDTLGVDANGIYLTVLQLVLPDGTAYGGHTIAAIKKPEIYWGTNLTTLIQVSPSDVTSWTIQPATCFDNPPLGGYAWFVGKGPALLEPHYQGGSILYRRLQWVGTNAVWADTNWSTASGTNYQDYYDLEGTNSTIFPGQTIAAPQAGTTTGIVLSESGSRLMNVSLRDATLWASQMVGLSGTNGNYTGDSSGTNVDRSAVQWLKMQTSLSAGGLAVSGHGRVFDTAPSGAWWYYFPSLAVNCAGDMVVGFSGSSQTNFINAFYTYRLGNGWMPAGPTSLRSSTLSNVGYRWGDYSATMVDPSDDWDFWSVQQYVIPWTNSTGGIVGRWATVVGSIRPEP